MTLHSAQLSPKVKHAEAVVCLSNRLLHQSQKLIKRISSKEDSASLSEQVKLYHAVLREMISEERSVLSTEIKRLAHLHAPLTAKIQAEMEALNMLNKKLHDLADQNAAMRILP